MGQDGGILDEVSWYRTMDSSCSGTSSDWRMASSTHAEGTDSSEWNEIAYNGSNIWRFQMYFPNRPESIFDPDCRDSGVDYRPWPVNFQYDVSIGSDEDASDLYFTHNEPQDGDGDSGNDELDLALDILGGVSGFYTSVGAAVIKFLIGGSGTSFESSNLGGSYSWDVPLEGNYDDLPHESDKARSAEVRLRVNNEYTSGTHYLDVSQSYTFGYYTDEDGSYCRCSSPISEWKKTATTKIHSPSYDVA
jgi:hypothetical protein